MLRLGLIENLQRITTRLLAGRLDRDLADLWVDRLQAMAEKNPSHLVVVVADMVFKPTLNDVPVLVAMGVVIVLSAVAFVVPVLRRPVLMPA